ncbi:sel1 repeat family protein [Luteolibacter flavescens]|uniref:Sel1 repeat family protein n=1 Tax=Luteolibacter flavescens TaxID=1859460 RepID=A0ABT3FME4_9BACT|nr:tetratricopeptide repeat protein [Luteolibacter flavescens]MCW1884733.1 sel1 repeat family protein [Luteolibacter flavescens]
MTAKTLLLSLALATVVSTSAPAAVSTGVDAPATVPSVAEGPAKAALDAFREGRHTAGVDLAKPLAEKGDADALFLLGFAAETGQGMPASRDAALESYKKSAAAGNKDATYRRALILLNSKEEKDRQEAREVLESAAGADPANAGRILGEAWLRGLLSEKPDSAKAAEWWTKAANAGDTPSILLLARFYEGAFGFKEEADAKKSLEYYQKAAALGDASALIPLGSRLLNGDESIRNEKEGREWLAKAIEKEQWSAYLALGDFEENIKKNEKEALAQYQKGAEKDQADCILRVAAFHLEGKGGLKKSEEKGREWLVKAAEAGNAVAALEMASRLSKDEKPEMISVYKYLLSAANTGLPVAQNEIGLLYVSGNLGLSDPTAAVAWFTAAAKAGHAAAQNNLGTLYERGMGVPVDYNNAGQLYSLAANQGHAAATTGLARLHAAGNGTTQDLPKAWALASLGIERGDEEAKTLLGELTSKMSEADIAGGKKELEALKKPAGEAPAPAPAPTPAPAPAPAPAAPKKTSAVTPAIEVPALEAPKEEKKGE